MLQLKKFPDIPVSTREEARESRPHPEEPRFRLLAREEGSFPCVVGKEFPVFPSHLKRRCSPQEKRVELQGRETVPRDPRFLSLFQGNLFSLHCLDFQAEDRVTPRWHVGQPCGKASWESLVGKPGGKASRESHRSLDPGEGKRDTAATAREESARACPHSRRGLTPLGRLQKFPKIHVSTGEESSGSGTDATQGLRPQHQRERNPERLPSNSHGDWPFLRPPARVPEVPVVSRELLPKLEKIQEVLPSWRDEAHIC